VRELGDFVARFHDLAPEALGPHLYHRLDDQAARHLFRVAAGLDSMVVGEPQIFGQVKEAYALAQARQRTGPLLNRLFHASFVTGKRVRTETGLGAGAVSVSYAAVSLAKKIFGDLAGLSVLILGAGEMAELTAMHLAAQHVARVTVASRTFMSARDLAIRVGGTAIAWRDLDAALGPADIVITATGATEPVLTRTRVESVMRARRNRPLFLIDIAVPRDVEASAADLEQVFLYDIDDLQAIVHENLAKRTAELERAEMIVSEELESFRQWLRARDAVPTVVALREHFESIRRSELQRLDHKIAGLGPDVRARVDEITHLLVEKLLLAPTQQLKSVGDRDEVVAYADALNRLFGLSREECPSEDAPRKTADRTPAGEEPS